MLALRRSALCLASILSFTVPAYAEQAGETYELPTSLGVARARNLHLVGKVWGYLKYHHSAVTNGCFDWDSELIERLPDLLLAEDREAVLHSLSTWGSALDDVDQSQDCLASVKNTATARSTAWISDQELLGPELSELLARSKSASATSRSQYYVSQSTAGAPLFQNERAYADVEELDWRYRLLALYRFWNIVEYWYPYRDLIGEEWDDVLAEFVPRLYAAKDSNVYLLELAMLVAKIKDGHANVQESLYVRPPAGRNLPPFSIRLVEGRPFVWRSFRIRESGANVPGAKLPDQLQFGDVILKVDGRPVEELFREATPYIGASNDTSRNRQIAQFLLHGNGGTVSMDVDRDGETLNVVNRRLPRESLEINLQHWHDREGPTFQLLSDDIAYLKLSTIDSNDVTKQINDAAGTKGLVIDIRSYPASFVVFSLGQHLMTTTTEFARFTRADLSRPGAFVWSDPVTIKPAEPYYEGKVVILVDESSISQSEYTAMAFRAAPNALVIGSETAGADGNVSPISLPGGYSTAISGIGVFYPDKTPTQRIGIVPDIDVKPTIRGLRAGRDEVLEVAVRQILGQDVPEQQVRDLASMLN